MASTRANGADMRFNDGPRRTGGHGTLRIDATILGLLDRHSRGRTESVWDRLSGTVFGLVDRLGESRLGRSAEPDAAPGFWQTARAVALVRSGRLVEAWSLCDAASAHADKTWRARLLEARILMLAGEPQAARACLEALPPDQRARCRRLERDLRRKLEAGPVRLRESASPTGAADTRPKTVLRTGWYELDPAAAIRSFAKTRQAQARRSLLMRALRDRRRHRAILWWCERPLGGNPAQQAESLLALGRFPEALALVSRHGEGNRGVVLRLRVLSEIHLRNTDLSALETLLAEAAAARPTRASGLSPFGWMLEFFGGHPRPGELLPSGVVERLMLLASRLETPRVQKRLALLFGSRFGKRLCQLSTCEDPAKVKPAARRAVLETWASSREPDSHLALGAYARTAARSGIIEAGGWQQASMTIDALLGEGDVEAAENLALHYVRNRSGSRIKPVSLAEMRTIASRFPMSVELVQHLIRLAEANGQPAVARHAAGWLGRIGSNDWSGLVGSARGKRCFIVGNGPSLTSLPLDRIRGHDVICVNRGYEAARWGLAPPRYLVVADTHVYGSHKSRIDAAPVERLFLHGGCIWSRPAPLPDNVVAFGTSSLRFSHRPLSFAPWIFHRGDTVVVIAAQIAAVLGYEEIVVIGVDLDFDGASTHFYGGNGRDRERLSSFRTGGIGNLVANAAFANLAETLGRRGVRIVNAGRGGNLESLPRVRLEEMF